MQLYQRREAETQAIGISLRKNGTQNLIENESGFKLGAGRSVLDRPDTIAQVELLRALFYRAEQSLQPAAKVRGLADVGSACASSLRRENTAGAAGTAEKTSASRSGANSRRSVSTSHSSVELERKRRQETR